MSVADEIEAKRQALLAKRSELTKERQELAAREAVINRELRDCEAAARLFGMLPAEDVILVGTMPSVREMALDQVNLKGANGVKARDIQAYVETTYNRRLHEKTVGMTLYRLLKNGEVRRKGHLWYPAIVAA